MVLLFVINMKCYGISNVFPHDAKQVILAILTDLNKSFIILQRLLRYSFAVFCYFHPVAAIFLGSVKGGVC